MAPARVLPQRSGSGIGVQQGDERAQDVEGIRRAAGHDDVDGRHFPDTPPITAYSCRGTARHPPRIRRWPAPIWDRPPPPTRGGPAAPWPGSALRSRAGRRLGSGWLANSGRAGQAGIRKRARRRFRARSRRSRPASSGRGRGCGRGGPAPPGRGAPQACRQVRRPTGVKGRRPGWTGRKQRRGGGASSSAAVRAWRDSLDPRPVSTAGSAASSRAMRPSLTLEPVPHRADARSSPRPSPAHHPRAAAQLVTGPAGRLPLACGRASAMSRPSVASRSAMTGVAGGRIRA